MHPAKEDTEKTKPTLKLDWCSHEAALYAVMHWHYSRTMPIGKMVKIGVWENWEFIGAVLFARGNSPTLGQRYGACMTEVCELVRVALKAHLAPVSRIVSIALRFLQKQSPGLRLVVSFADPAHDHHGGIYQAGNWIYCGVSSPEFQFFHNGEWKHRREITSGAFGNSPKVLDRGKSLPKHLTPGKHRYLMPLDDAMRLQLAPLAKPYPKRICAASIDSDAPGFQPEEGSDVRTKC